MFNLFQKFQRFMQGRYFMDTLNRFLLVLVLILSVISMFIPNIMVRMIFVAVELALLGLFLFRCLSRNIPGRMRENRIFEKAFNPVKNFFVLSFRKIRERKDYRYIKCPACKAQLRVKNIKGTHRVRCPKCSNEFRKTIR